MSYRDSTMERSYERARRWDDVQLAVRCEVRCAGGSAPADVREAERAASHVAAERAVARLGERRADDRVLLSRTHSHGRGAAVALRDGQGVSAGIDLEREGGVRERFARYFLTDAERKRAGARELAELWALKEAAWKALRLDDTVHFTALELVFDDGGEVVGLMLHGRERPARATISRPWPGFVLAVVLVGDAA
jgi:4'-phosphopantetheinyl transferase EntD